MTRVRRSKKRNIPDLSSGDEVGFGGGVRHRDDECGVVGVVERSGSDAGIGARFIECDQGNGEDKFGGL